MELMVFSRGLWVRPLLQRLPLVNQQSQCRESIACLVMVCWFLTLFAGHSEHSGFRCGGCHEPIFLLWCGGLLAVSFAVLL